MLKRLTVIGVGLIGGSLVRALRRAGAVDEVVGCGRDVAHLQKACDLGVIDRFESAIDAAVHGADMVVVAVPLGAMESVFRSMAGHLAADCVVTDVGSAKGSVVQAAERAFGGSPAYFVPGHPIAGTEKSGVEASFAELFQERRVILTPLAYTQNDAVAKVRRMWELAGASVVDMSVQHHDEVLAATSHLPHLLAYGLVDTLVGMDESEEIFRYAAGGFRDFTRIASSDPVMWHDICVANRDAILKVLDLFLGDMQSLREAVAGGDGGQIKKVFTRAKAARDRFCMKGVASE